MYGLFSLKPLSADNRKSIFNMGISYAAGIFNDHLFKQVVLLFALSFKAHFIPGLSAILFSLPFVICSAWAGWFADNKPKRSVLIYAKFFELMIMFLGMIVLLNRSWSGMIVVICMMGLQFAFFSPAFNGLIPENAPDKQIPYINSCLKILGLIMVLAGIGIGELLMSDPHISPWKYWQNKEYMLSKIIGSILVLMSAAGFFSALNIKKNEEEKTVSKAAFPYLGPLDSFFYAASYRKKAPSLFLILIGEAFFYAFSFFSLLCINNLGVRQLALGVVPTSLVIVFLLMGVAMGIFLVGKEDAQIWRKNILTSGTGLFFGVFVSSFVVFLPKNVLLQTGFLIAVYFLTGICAGKYLIPLISKIQILPAKKEKGKVVALSNFLSFSGIIFAYFLFSVFDWKRELTGDAQAATLLAGASMIGFAFLVWMYFRLRSIFPLMRYSFFGICLQMLLSLRYRITSSGLDRFTAKGPVLFLPNHPALIDPFIIYSQLAAFSPRPLADENQLTGLPGKLVTKWLNVITMPDLVKDGAKAINDTQRSLQAVLACLKEGDHVLMYPSGRIYHSSKENIGGKSGVWSLIQQAPDVQVVLARTTGLWGSSFSYGATGSAPDFNRSLLRGIGTVLINLILLVPKRRVHVEFVELVNPALVTDRRQLNRQLEAFYNEAEMPAFAVPRFFLQGSAPIRLPEYAVHKNIADTRNITNEMREAVFDLLREVGNLPKDYPIYDSMSLSNDLSLDSLMLMEVTMAIEERYHQSVPSLEMLNTVADCLLLANGQLDTEIPSPAPQAWFDPPSREPLLLSESALCIVEAFFKQLKHNPKDPLLAERSALRNRKQLFLGAVIIAKRLNQLPGERIGIMMPSVPAATVIWLAALLAGKVPVFYNWTVGEVNLRHCISLTETAHIISASALMERLEAQGLPLNELPVQWIAIDKMAAGFSLFEKVSGLLRSAFMRDTKYFPIPKTAAILFTSGSESSPKGVPLTHQNLLTNAADIIQVLNLAPDDTVLAMLPPFHSFGLMVGLVIPLATGIKAVYHPNPTEPGLLNGLIRDFAVSLLAMPPTFMSALLEQARGSTRLSSVKYAFVGAEKCPEHVYRAFAEQCPDAALCEGYGITECAPGVSVNRPGNVIPGTIGHLLPSVTGVVVNEEDEVISSRAQTGQTGMLLLRGPSIFEGYIGEAPSPFVEFEGNLWYRTGDLVSMDETGRLTFQGRLKRFVKVGGEMISLPQIEHILLEAYASHPAAPKEGPALAVEASSDDTKTEIVVFTPLPLRAPGVNSVLKKAGLSPLYSIKRVKRMKEIPLLGSGKVDYRALKTHLK